MTACFAIALAVIAQPAPPSPAASAGPAEPLPELVVSADDTIVSRSCRIKIAPGKVLQDFNDNGVIHIAAPGVTVEFDAESWVVGAISPSEPDSYKGVGIRVYGQKDVTIRGARVRGYKCGILATNAPGLVVEDCLVRDVYRQRLRSTPEAEDPADWLWPHENDKREWLTKYGAAICIEETQHATIRRCRVRESQNGLLLDRVSASGVYDNDFSFLSGWGVAMWRSSENLLSRNALDFCIRGYSHGVYNRGQDSAGILMFEQCNGNTIAENSATHGGDGLFLFAGKEALGERPPLSGGAFDYTGKGCNKNLIIGNDFSFAAAHGVETTFSFDNRIIENRMVSDGICGLWGGYSQRMQVQGNTFEGCGAPGAGEGGGVNIEHGFQNLIANNTFKGNSVGVSLWSDADDALMKTPWAKANHKGSLENVIASNTFEKDTVGVRIRATKGTQLLANTMKDVPTAVQADDDSPVQQAEGTMDIWVVPPSGAMGDRRPVGARPALAGRDKIVMTEWGPWDHESPFIRFVERTGEGDVYEVIGAKVAKITKTSTKSVTKILPASAPASLRFSVAGDVVRTHAYLVAVSVDGEEKVVRGTFIPLQWNVRVFPWTTDPRTDLEGWRKQSQADGVQRQMLSGQIRLPLGSDGPSAVPAWRENAAKLAWKSNYGIVAETSTRLMRGRYRISTLSDDGIRVTVNATPSPRPPIRVVPVENWTHHGPERNRGEFVMPESGEASIVVEYFQMDGFAALELNIERIADN